MLRMVRIAKVHKKELGNFRELPENSRKFPAYVF